MKQITLIAITFLTCLIGHSQTTTTRTISIAPHLSFENYEHFKRLTLKSPDSEADYITNFEFEWGYDYKLSVKETRLKSDLSDGTRYEYELDRVVSKIEVPDSIEFRLFIDPNIYYYSPPPEEQLDNQSLKSINDSTYLYFDSVEIEVPENLRDRFISVTKSQNGKLGFFTFAGKNRIRLIRLR